MVIYAIMGFVMPAQLGGPGSTLSILYAIGLVLSYPFVDRFYPYFMEDGPAMKSLGSAIVRWKSAKYTPNWITSLIIVWIVYYALSRGIKAVFGYYAGTMFAVIVGGLLAVLTAGVVLSFVLALVSKLVDGLVRRIPLNRD